MIISPRYGDTVWFFMIFARWFRYVGVCFKTGGWDRLKQGVGTTKTQEAGCRTLKRTLRPGNNFISFFLFHSSLHLFSKPVISQSWPIRSNFLTSWFLDPPDINYSCLIFSFFQVTVSFLKFRIASSDSISILNLSRSSDTENGAQKSIR